MENLTKSSILKVLIKEFCQDVGENSSVVTWTMILWYLLKSKHSVYSLVSTVLLCAQ